MSAVISVCGSDFAMMLSGNKKLLHRINTSIDSRRNFKETVQHADSAESLAFSFGLTENNANNISVLILIMMRKQNADSFESLKENMEACIKEIANQEGIRNCAVYEELIR